MQHYDHALLGATLALATGTQRKYGLAIVVMATLAGTLPDWDALPSPAGTAGYLSVHRVWGHNLLVAPLLSGLVGAVGYLCWHSLQRPREEPARNGNAVGQDLAVWILIGMLTSLGHVLTDVFYCGTERTVDWPVRLFWPFSPRPFGLPLVPFADRGVTWILGIGLVAACLRPALSRVFAVLALLVMIAYVIFRGLTP